MALEIIVTAAGRAALVNARNTGTVPVLIDAIGLTATAITPNASASTLPGEFKRLPGVAGMVVADDTIHLSVNDAGNDAYTLRGFALYLADGTLFAIYGQPAPIIEKTAQSVAALSVDVIFADIAAAALTFGNAEFVNPPASTTVPGVVELATLDEARAGVDALRALTSAGAKAAILGWLLAQDGAGSGIDADMLDGWHCDDIRKWGNLLDKPFQWSGQAGQPRWLWGSNDGKAYQVWNPENFSVNYANSAGWAGSAGNADTLDGMHWSSFFRVGRINLGIPGHIGIVMPGGEEFLLQWTTASIGANSSIIVNYPLAYASWSKAWLEGMPNDPGPYQNPPGVVQNSATTTGCRIVNGWDSGSVAVTVFSIGV